jgi:hypothetical protein
LPHLRSTHRDESQAPPLASSTAAQPAWPRQGATARCGAQGCALACSALANPPPLGLLGLAIGCAALEPIAFGHPVTPAGLKTAAMFCLLFGAGGQILAGMMALANKNLPGGTLFTTFSFNWVMNRWALSGMAEGRLPVRASSRLLRAPQRRLRLV